MDLPTISTIVINIIGIMLGLYSIVKADDAQMKNFLQETLEAIEDSGHTPEDIVFIGSTDSGHQCTWEEFRLLADCEYDSSSGSSKVAIDLNIYFRDGSSMWREEYDGSEWWEYSEPFRQPDVSLPIKSLFASGWVTLGEINEEVEQ